jgi:hypothetical protein
MFARHLTDADTWADIDTHAARSECRMKRIPPTPPGLLAHWPRTRFADGRARSRLARVVDGAIGLAGVALVCVPLLDSVGTFRSNDVLIYPARLNFVAGVLLVFSWPWLLVSAYMIGGIPRPRRAVQGAWNLRTVNWRRAAPWLAAFGVIVAVVVAGFVIGASKGSLRILPSGIHQVSAVGLHLSQWTTVSSAEYRLWAARFVRGEAALSLFGFVVIGFVVLMRQLRRWLRNAGML